MIKTNIHRNGFYNLFPIEVPGWWIWMKCVWNLISLGKTQKWEEMIESVVDGLAG